MSAALQLDARLEFLATVSLFEDLKHDRFALSALADIMREQKFPRGATIIKEGSEGREMFLLVTGNAGVFKATPGGDEYKVALLPSEMKPAFGEGGLIHSDRRTATIRAEADCVCLSLDRDDFDRFARAHPQWALPLFRRIATGVMIRLRKTNDDMLLLYNALVGEIRGR